MAKQKTLGIRQYKTAQGIRWAARWVMKGHDPVYKTFDTKAAAEAWKNGMDVDAGRGKFDASTSVPPDLTLAQLLLEYIKRFPSKNQGREMRNSGQRQIKALARHDLLKDVLVANLTRKTVARWADHRVNEEGVDPSTVGVQYSFLHTAVKRMTRWLDWENFAPLADCAEALREDDLIADSHCRERRPQPGELDALRAYFKEENQRKRHGTFKRIPMDDIIALSSLNAFRRGEIVQLKWSELDVEKHLIWCERKYSKNKKTGKRRCQVPIFPAAMEILLRQPRIEGEDRIFPYNLDQITTRFAKACEVLGINKPGMPKEQRLRFHDNRHEAVSEMSLHLPQSLGMAVSGHFTAKNYQRYTNLKEADLIKAVQAGAHLQVKSASNVVPIKKAA